MCDNGGEGEEEEEEERGAGVCVLPLAIGISLVFRIILLAFSTRDEEQLCSLHVVVAPAGYS